MLRAVAARVARAIDFMPVRTMVSAASSSAGIDFVMRARQQIDELAPADGPVVRVRDRLDHHCPQAVVETHLPSFPYRLLRLSLAGCALGKTGGRD